MDDTSILSFLSNDPKPIDGVKVLSDLSWLLEVADQRMITDASLWANELIVSLPVKWMEAYEDSKMDIDSQTSRCNSTVSLKTRDFNFAKSLMLKRDFHRANFYLYRCRDESSLNKFMYYWSRYLACCKDQSEHDAETFDKRVVGSTINENVPAAELLEEIRVDKTTNVHLHDFFMNYLIGKLELIVGLRDRAFQSLKSVVKAEPRFWPAWEELLNLVPKPEDLEIVCALDGNSGHSWMAQWFACLCLQRFSFTKVSISRTEDLIRRGFHEVPLLLSHIASCYNYGLDHVEAVKHFERVHEMDPMRLEHMHLYSDSLFCKGDRVTLTSLTHKFFKTHKFTWETCCIVANYYNLRRDHEQSIRFFQRALRLNPGACSVWVLIGHEFLELKNNAAACLAYRRATEIDPRDFRGWYSLGQMYDILKMPAYSLYHYQQAHKCKPQDSRVLVALGVAYSKVDRIHDARICFTSAFKYGDVEGNVLWYLAKLFEGQNQHEHAARIYEEYMDSYLNARLEEYDDNAIYILKFLAKFYCSVGEWEKAKNYAKSCLEHDTICDEGRLVLQEIDDKKREADLLAANSATNEDITASPSNLSDCDNMAVSDGEDVSFD